MTVFARRLRARLDHLKMSRAKLSDLTGFHESTLKKLAEGGSASLQQPARFLALCRALQVTPAQLLGFEPLPRDVSGRSDLRDQAVDAVLAAVDGLDEGRLRFAAELLDLLHQHRETFRR
ncbi:helix-turn-helix transcriptional regulator [Arenibaculum sp.]|uniref:helix-turn-helix domain-containing protein n=1 Tax=Arenibaculum sp. TaxID=2865862 RepID=UPI002E1428C6|nr:helix-turn-helix transcriptional regulator [Arenibaculum sp.]